MMMMGIEIGIMILGLAVTLVKLKTEELLRCFPLLVSRNFCILCIDSDVSGSQHTFATFGNFPNGPRSFSISALYYKALRRSRAKFTCQLSLVDIYSIGARVLELAARLQVNGERERERSIIQIHVTDLVVHRKELLSVTA